MKLYQFEIEGGFGPKLIKTGTNSNEAGKFCYEHGNHEKVAFFLLHEGRLYYYVDMPDGYGWEACEDEEEGPAFCTD